MRRSSSASCVVCSLCKRRDLVLLLVPRACVEVSRREPRLLPDRRRLDQIDEPNAQRASRTRYLRARHHAGEQACASGIAQVKRHHSNGETSAQQCLSPPTSLAPLELRDGRRLRRLDTTTFRLCSLQPSHLTLHRVLALAGAPAPNDAPYSTSTSALNRVRPLHGHAAKGRGRTATAWPCGRPSSATTRYHFSTTNRIPGTSLHNLLLSGKTIREKWRSPSVGCRPSRHRPAAPELRARPRDDAERQSTSQRRMQRP